MLENDLTPIDNSNRSEEFKEGYKAYGYYVVNPYELGTSSRREWNYGQIVAQQHEIEFKNKYRGLDE